MSLFTFPMFRKCEKRHRRKCGRFALLHFSSCKIKNCVGASIYRPIPLKFPQHSMCNKRKHLIETILGYCTVKKIASYEYYDVYKLKCFTNRIVRNDVYIRLPEVDFGIWHGGVYRVLPVVPFKKRFRLP